VASSRPICALIPFILSGQWLRIGFEEIALVADAPSGKKAETVAFGVDRENILSHTYPQDRLADILVAQPWPGARQGVDNATGTC
jgi:hypothetical protein